MASKPTLLKKTPTYATDQDLAAACARNDPRAQRQLYDQYVDSLYHSVYRYCFRNDQAEDILQIAFSKAFAAIRLFDGKKGSLKTWLKRICVNTAIDVVKKERKWEPAIPELPPYLSAVEPLPFNELGTEEILQLIAQLPVEQRTIFNLYEIEGYSHEEIASMLDINANSCRVYLSRAKKKLRQGIRALESINTR